MYCTVQRSLLSAQSDSHPNDTHQLESYLLKKCFLGGKTPVSSGMSSYGSAADSAEGFSSFLEKRPAKWPMTAADVDLTELDQASKWRGRLPSRSKL